MTLPMKVVDRLVSRLEATYGAEWARQWATVPVSDLKTTWAHELSSYTGRLHALAWALENLPERCPNVIQFRNLCRQAPSPEAPQLPEPQADPARVAQELARLSELRAACTQPAPGRLDWAHQVMGRSRAGEWVSSYALKCAKQALRIGS